MWIILGFVIGAVGTLLGVGGGVVLVPILLHMYPDAPSHWVGGVAMAMVALNATSGSISYYFKNKIHLKTGLLFVVMGIPGGVYGVVAEHFVDRPLFERIFGVAMALFAVALLLRPKSDGEQIKADSNLSRGFYVKGGALSLIIGFCSSFLSVGGGVFHVPALTHVLGFPVHLATATSQFVLACTAWVAMATHLWHGDINLTEPLVWQLALSAAAGAQFGARLAPRVKPNLILRALALLLGMVGIHLLFRPH